MTQRERLLEAVARRRFGRANNPCGCSEPNPTPSQTSSTYSLKGVTGAMQVWRSPLTNALALARLGTSR